MERVKSFFGGRTRAQKWAQIDAEKAQALSARDAEEERQRLAAERGASGRRLRGAGRRALTWQGLEGGVAARQSSSQAATMGG